MRTAPGLILTYHRVTTLARDPLSMAVTPERFADHLRVAQEMADCVPLSQIGTRPRRTIAITLDDGYADSAETASAVIAQAGTPATLFVTSEVMNGLGEFWWDRLEHLLLDSESQTDALRLEIAGQTLHVDVRTLAGRQRAYRALNHRLRPLPAARIEQHVREVAEQVGDHGTACRDHRHLSREQLRDLDRSGVFEIGGHTRTHTMLTALDRGGQRDEIAGSRDDLAGVVGHAIESFAYPFGNPVSLDSTTLGVVKDAGYKRACINTGGLVKGRTNPFLLPRRPVYDWPADEFRSRIEGWFYEG